MSRNDTSNEPSEGKIRNKLNKVIHVNTQITLVLEDLNKKKDLLAEYYRTLVTHNPSKLYLFGLDSLQFQSQMIKIEYENLMKFHKIIRNRIYGDFFKLYHIIRTFIKTNPKTNKILDNRTWNAYPQYKDLKTEQNFSFELVVELFNDVTEMILLLSSHIEQLEGQLLDHRRKMSMGLNINNFIFTFESCNQIVHNKIALFRNYIDYMTKIHYHYLRRFHKRALLLLAHIGKDVQFHSGDTPNEPPSDTESEDGDGDNNIPEAQASEPQQQDPPNVSMNVERPDRSTSDRN